MMSKMEKKINTVLEGLECGVKQRINSTISNVVDQVNESLNGIIASLMKHSEELEDRIKQDILTVKVSINENLASPEVTLGKTLQDIRDSMVKNNNKIHNHADETVESSKTKQNKDAISTNGIKGSDHEIITLEDDHADTIQSLSENPTKINELLKEAIKNPNQINGIAFNSTAQPIMNGSLDKTPTHVRVAPPSSSNIKCDQCNYAAGNKHVMELHIKHVHEKRFVCEYCNYSTGDNRWLSTHVKSVHLNGASSANT